MKNSQKFEMQEKFMPFFIVTFSIESVTNACLSFSMHGAQKILNGFMKKLLCSLFIDYLIWYDIF